MRYTDCTEQQESLNATYGDFVDIKADFSDSESYNIQRKEKIKKQCTIINFFFFHPSH